MLSLAACICCCLVSAAGGASPMPKLDFEKYTLPNGLDVILHVDHSRRS